MPVPLALEELRGCQPSELLFPKLHGVQYFPLPDFVKSLNGKIFCSNGN